MGIESIKQWQWAGIGLLVGLGVATVRVQTGASAPLDDRPGILLHQFVGMLSVHGADDQPAVRALTIYPELDGKVFVTGELARGADSPSPTFRPFQLNTPVPFKIPFGPDAPSANYTVRDHLAQNHPDVKYRYAWWASDRAQYALWTGGSLLVIGGLWPLLLRLLVGAGYGKPLADPAYDLDRFGHGSDPTAPPPADLTPAEAAQLEAAARSLETTLASAGPAPAGRVPAPDKDSPVVALSNIPLEPVPTADDVRDPKEYKGQFYPVAMPVQKPGDSH
jgi:hypothetical protein